MEQEKQGYKSMAIGFQQEELDCMLDGKLMYYRSGNKASWIFSIFDTVQKKHIYEGNLQETIELILLGKVLKAQIQAADADAEIQGKKAAFAQSAKMNACTLCGTPVLVGENPHNDCVQREAYLQEHTDRS